MNTGSDKQQSRVQDLDPEQAAYPMEFDFLSTKEHQALTFPILRMQKLFGSWVS